MCLLVSRCSKQDTGTVRSFRNGHATLYAQGYHISPSRERIECRGISPLLAIEIAAT